MIRTTLVLALALALSPLSAQAFCNQKGWDTGFKCMSFKNQKDCDGHQQKIYGKMQSACAWLVAKPPVRGSPAAVKGTCQYCGNPTAGFITAMDANLGSYQAVFKDTKEVDAKGACPAGWLKFGTNNAAYGKTPDDAIAAAKKADSCK